MEWGDPNLIGMKQRHASATNSGTGRREMEKRDLLPTIGIVVMIMLFSMKYRADAPLSAAQWIAQDVKTAGEIVMNAGKDFKKAEEEFMRVGKKLSGIVREVTAYNVGVREQTSDTPCIGASGRNLCEMVDRKVKVCAANFVPLGTILRIEEYGMCVVLDRMHKRFSHRVDIAMSENEIEEARRFGLKKRVVEAVF
jgi:3D (Asp-Asp-Asp) domain-containing protein